MAFDLSLNRLKRALLKRQDSDYPENGKSREWYSCTFFWRGNRKEMTKNEKSRMILFPNMESIEERGHTGGKP